MTEPPASPRRDQIEARLRDLRRLREFFDLYPPEPGAGIHTVMHRMTPADRAETGAILARLGTVDSGRAAHTQRQLHALAGIEATALQMRDRHQSDPEIVEVAQDLLNMVNRLRSQITGLGED